MRFKQAFLGLGLLLALPVAAQEKNYVSEVWSPDLGNGKYKNPVLLADYSDPDAIRVGDDFYLTGAGHHARTSATRQSHLGAGHPSPQR